MKYFIAGIPGTAKTTIGNLLSKTHGFKHLDMEDGIHIHKLLSNKESFIKEMIEEKENIVITWGFPVCVEFIDTVVQLKNGGYKLIWMDGDRCGAFRSFVIREKNEHPERLVESINAFEKQIHNIDSFKLVSQINPIVINPFNEKNEYKSMDDVIIEIKKA